ncbi:type II toxin-antitoxin system RelE family toxin [Burkholderia diffusa]|uniref:type II toxin-antitoxin system RelE family toxin n=1 Tax=Burkholderia diffusa TaxID=488732 RepID=UPI003F50E197
MHHFQRFPAAPTPSTPAAACRVARASSPTRERVGTFEAMPNCHNVKSLTNHEYGYRLRVGNYRVLFNWDGEIKVVEVEEVKKRDERTY